MCGGVYYSLNDGDVRFYFPNPKARLPVRMRSGSTQLLGWGRRPDQAGKLPLGGWARLDGIYEGRWDRWFPIPVKVPVKSFMEQDIEGRSRWYDLTRGQWIQGLVDLSHATSTSAGFMSSQLSRNWLTQYTTAGPGL